jgi:uncharacterized membrane protein
MMHGYNEHILAISSQVQDAAGNAAATEAPEVAEPSPAGKTGATAEPGAPPAAPEAPLQEGEYPSQYTHPQQVAATERALKDVQLAKYRKMRDELQLAGRVHDHVCELFAWCW